MVKHYKNPSVSPIYVHLNHLTLVSVFIYATINVINHIIIKKILLLSGKKR